MNTDSQALFTMITLDGEHFQMRIPTTGQLKRLLDHLKKDLRLEEYLSFAHPVFTHDYAKNFTRKLVSVSPDGETTMGLVTRKNNRYVFTDDLTKDLMAFFHPCLMPISMSGQLMPITEDSVPTGTIVHGGTIYQGDDPAILPVIGVDSISAGLTVWDGDIKDERLSYVAFEGMLWSIKPLLLSNTMTLYNTWIWEYTDYTPADNTGVETTANEDDLDEFPF